MYYIFILLFFYAVMLNGVKHPVLTIAGIPCLLPRAVRDKGGAFTAARCAGGDSRRRPFPRLR